jgi:hypothetical protein
MCAVRHMIWVEKWNYKPLSRPVWDGTSNHELVFYPYLIPTGIIKICIKSSVIMGVCVRDVSTIRQRTDRCTIVKGNNLL